MEMVHESCSEDCLLPPFGAGQAEWQWQLADEVDLVPPLSEEYRWLPVLEADCFSVYRGEWPERSFLFHATQLIADFEKGEHEVDILLSLITAALHP